MLGRVPIAFIAGFLSVLAPCVLPLVPGYLSAVSAVEPSKLGERGASLRVVRASIPFFAGFTAVFVALGAGAGALGNALGLSQRLLLEIAGFIIVVLGLAFLGLIPWPERVLAPTLLVQAQSRRSNVLIGGAFGVCAAPCIGPVLASILVLAGNTSSVAEGAALLAVYSLGLAVPFVAAGALFTRSMGAFRWLRNHYTAIQVVGGSIMVALGLLLFFERFYVLRVYLNRFLEWLGLEPAF
jgi:cytochrome c-type biogenesis protein